MSLKGILHGQKEFITKLLEPHGFYVQGIKTHEIDENSASYDIIYDVDKKSEFNEAKDKWLEPRTVTQIANVHGIAELLKPHYPEYDIEVEFVREVRHVKSGGNYRWRAVSLIYFFKMPDDDEEEDDENE